MPQAPIPENERERLRTLRRYQILDTLPEREFEDATALAAYICGTPISLVSLVDERRQWFKARVGLAAEQTGRAESFCAYSLAPARMVVVDDALLDARFADNPLVLDQPGIRFYAGAPLIAANGHVLGTLCVIDTEPRHLSEAQLKALEALSRQVMGLIEARLLVIDNQMKAEALIRSEKLAAVGRMAAAVAHEINNPLEAVTNLLYLARMQAENAMVRGWMEQADAEVRRVGAIANQTLRFHRQSSKPTAVTCTSLFEATLHLYESRLRNSRISVEKKKRAAEPVECFEGDIRQVLSNLVTNAIDSMPEGGRLLVRSREATEWKTRRRGLALTIADTGVGIPAETVGLLFEPFITTKGINGSGLGLWISAEILERHGGTIRLKSSRRKGRSGTVAVVFLPFLAAPVGVL